MKYQDLIQFTPITTLIKLTDADESPKARELVRTYVISDTMANKLKDVAANQLQFDSVVDNKGLLIVGNYGTGKSHLMSVLTSVAENADLLQDLTSQNAMQGLAPIAGKFKVVRVELGSTQRALRDILLEELELALSKWDIDFTFPKFSEITNNKIALIDMMAIFAKKFQNKGLILVVDELLDYLRTREERALILDLGFLRELGEVASDCPFRFIGGVQETLFENPRFSFVAEQLRRVKARFDQINIAREDINFVVTRRILQKTEQQKASIAAHLDKFTNLYGNMLDNLPAYIDLFPIHPEYIKVFEDLIIAEKRDVLKTFSSAIQTILKTDIPTDQPGLVSYDHFWNFLQEDAGLRSIDDIARVIEKSKVLEGLIQASYTRPALKPLALRVIRGISVQRLTTSDINLPIGVTAEGLRDGLCLYQRLPDGMNTAEFLLDQVKIALNEIMNTVHG